MGSLFSGNSLLSNVTSITTTYYLIRSASDLLIPGFLRTYLHNHLNRLGKLFFSSELTIVIPEFEDLAQNYRFNAANIYLGTQFSPLTKRIRVHQPAEEVERNEITVDKGEEIVDSFNGIQFTWWLRSEIKLEESDSSDEDPKPKETRFFELTFNKKHKDLVLNAYLPHVTNMSNKIKEETKVLRLHAYDEYEESWRSSIALTHPATFETIAMEPETKTKLIEDLDKFKSRKDYYRRVGKAWKRGYLLYGPPGTGKSSLIAAMAEYLNFDIYDLDLKSVRYNSQLKNVLLRSSNKSILVIEDIDCSGVKAVKKRKSDGEEDDDDDDDDDDDFRGGKITLSGLLNFIDGLWSSVGEERIIVFTTNHREKLDPALLRPGRMDVHIEMSYCRFGSFKTLARNYLRVEDHKLFGKIEVLLSEVEVSPADVAGQLMMSDDPDVALDILVQFLTSKKIRLESQSTNQEAEKKEEIEEAEKQEPEKEEEKEEADKKQGNSSKITSKSTKLRNKMLQLVKSLRRQRNLKSRS